MKKSRPASPRRPARRTLSTAAPARESKSVATPAPLKQLPPTSQLETLAAWLAFAEDVYERGGVALGQVATTAHDEALYLLLRTLDWPLDSDARVLEHRIEPAQRIALRRVLEKRILERIPAAYLTREAWLGEHRFYVDERVIIPRSYVLEHVASLQIDALLADAGPVRRVADVCTGSGCLAILLAHHFPKARVDAFELSPDALAVAKINVAAHRLVRRVQLVQSDVFDALPPPPGGYDLILSNPPYEPSAVCDALPAEFQQEPRLALDGGADGLVIIRKLLRQAGERIAPQGIVLIEVGGLRAAMDREFLQLGLAWLPSIDGSDCVCAIRAEALLAHPVPAAGVPPRAAKRRR